MPRVNTVEVNLTSGMPVRFERGGVAGQERALFASPSTEYALGFWDSQMPVALLIRHRLDVGPKTGFDLTVKVVLSMAEVNELEAHCRKAPGGQLVVSLEALNRDLSGFLVVFSGDPRGRWFKEVRGGQQMGRALL